MIFELALCLTVLVLYWIWKDGRPPSGFPPGPRGIPIAGYLPFMGREGHKKLSGLSKVYGHIIGLKLGVWNVIVLNDAKLALQVFKNDLFNGRPNIPMWCFAETGNHGVIRSNQAQWVEQRRFTLHNLRDLGFGKTTMETLIASEAKLFCDKLRQYVGQEVDLQYRFNTAVLNSLWYISTGERCPDEDPVFEEVIALITKLISDPTVFAMCGMMPYIAKIFPKWSHFNQLCHLEELLNKRICEKIKSRRQIRKSGVINDFLDAYLNQIENETDPESSFYGEKGEHNLMVVLQDFFIAGSETTSTALTWMFLYLILYPDYQKRIQTDIDHVIGRDKSPSFEHRNQLPFLEAFMHEMFRISSIVPFSVYHCTVKTTELNGYIIPKDTMVFPNLWHIHHSTELWGDPENFRPERFLSPEGKFKASENVLPFGQGKRTCIGEPLAKMEIFMFTSSLLQTFDFSFPSGVDPPTLTPDTALLIRPQKFSVVPTLRT